MIPFHMLLHDKGYGPAFPQSDWLIAGPYHTIRTTFSTFAENHPFSRFRCSERASSKILIKFYPVLFSGTLISDKRFVNIRTTYQTMCPVGLARKSFLCKIL